MRQTLKEGGDIECGFEVLGGCVDRRMDGWMEQTMEGVGAEAVVRGRVLQLLPHVIVGGRFPPLQRHKTDLGRTLQSGERALSGSI